MRASSRARGVSCALAIPATALALVVALPLAAAERATPRAARSIASCTSFDQEEKDEATVTLRVANSCTIPVDCSLSWRVVCAPESKKRRAEHRGAAAFSLTTAGAQATDATAAMCGDDAWVLDSVTWSCAPNKD